MEIITLTLQQVRRLAIAKQRLSGTRPDADADGILEVFRNLGCVQIDPIRAVERTQYLVLWSRLGNYDMSDLDRLIFQDKLLFEYWAHAASIVLTENYPIHQYQMHRFSERTNGQGSSAWDKRLSDWIAVNDDFRRYIFDEMRRHGPRALKDLEDRSVANWQSSGWSSNRRVAMMVQMMWERGEVMVVERQGSRKRWDLSEHWLADRCDSPPLDGFEVTRRAAQISLQALGVGTARHIRNHFIRNAYQQLPEVLETLCAEKIIYRVSIPELEGDWYIHQADITLLDSLENSAWQPRTVLLSPFDNLICDRDRTELIWDFRFRIEIYVPASKREFGYYTMPILQGERLIGRLDPKMDRKSDVLHVNAVYAEDHAPQDRATGQDIAATIADLARFLGAKSIKMGEGMPPRWAPTLRKLV